MQEPKTRRSLYRTRTVRSITQTMQPIVSKYLIDFRTDQEELSARKSKVLKQQRHSFRSSETILDRIISKLRRNYKPQDILLMITPASRHVNLYKLHVIQRYEQGHLGMTTITHQELSRLKASKAFHKYCMVFSSRFIDLKTVVLQSETIRSLVNSLNKKCCGELKLEQPNPKESNNLIKSYTSSAGDYFNTSEENTIQLQDSYVQTDPEKVDDINISFNDILQLIDNINQALEPCKKDIDHFFYVADKLQFTLIVRPELLWKSSCDVKKTEDNGVYFHVESYLPGNCYLGCITLLESDIWLQLDLHPKLLFNTQVIEDVYEITPLPKKLVNFLKKVLGFLKLELLYDALGEMIFEWYKHITFL
ncbi:uncharacterized protein ACRADG_004071 [Cochliomyia hominivorax]